jgi:hypothetical protein
MWTPLSFLLPFPGPPSRTFPVHLWPTLPSQHPFQATTATSGSGLQATASLGRRRPPLPSLSRTPPPPPRTFVGCFMPSSPSSASGHRSYSSSHLLDSSTPISSSHTGQFLIPNSSRWIKLLIYEIIYAPFCRWLEVLWNWRMLYSPGWVEGCRFWFKFSCDD